MVMISVADSDGFLHFFQMKLNPMSLQLLAIACWVCLKTGYPPRVLPNGYRITHPLKCILKGEAGHFSYMSTKPPLKQHLLYELFTVEYIR